jgi:hypothetical protein
MSQSSIGKASLILTTDGSSLRSDLGKDLKNTESQVAASNSRLAAAGRAATGGGLAGGLISAAPKAVAAAAVIAVGVKSVSSSIDTLQELAKGDAAAKAFGLTAEQFTGIAGVAKSTGEDTREFIESLVTLGKVASEGAAGKGEVATAFFSDLKLDAKEFASLRLDEQFYKVFEAIQKVESPAARVRALMTAFGEDGGKYLLPLLSKSPAEIRKMGASFAVSAQDMAKATKANAALTQAGTTLQMAWRKIAVAMAPAITLVAGLVGRLAPVFDWLGRVASTYIELWSAVWGEIISGIGSAVQAIGEWVGQVAGLTGPWPTVEEVIVGAFRVVGTAGALVWDTMKAGIGAVSIAVSLLVDGFGVLVMAFGKVVGLAKMLPDELRPAWVDGMVDGIAEFEAKVHGRAEKMRTWGAEAITGWGKSGAQFNDWLDRIRKPAAAAAVAGSSKIEGAAEAAAAEKYKANNPLLAGSSAEVSARLKHEVGTKATAERHLEESRKANAFLGDIKTGIKSVAEKILPIGLLPL